MSEKTKRRHIIGLDTLKLIAIILIVIYHCFPGALTGGFIAVEIFFAISGFLIGQKLLSEYKIKKDKFLKCFDTQKTVVTKQYPHAFDFMDDGFEFLLFMIGIALLYFWIISPKVDELINTKNKEPFNYGDWLKQFGKTVYGTPEKIYNTIKEKNKTK